MRLPIAKLHLIAMAWGMVAALGARGDVWADVKYYWSFDRDVNGDGIVQASEVRDVRHWEDGAVGGLLPESIQSDGDGQAPTWRHGSVYWPARGITIPDTTCLHISCTTSLNESGKIVGTSSGMTFPAGNNIKGDVTVVTRIRADRFGFSEDGNAFFLNNGESWWSKTGGLFGFKACDATHTNANAQVLLGTTFASMWAVTLYTNVWYDIGYSVKSLGDGTAEVVFMVAGLNSQWNNPRGESLRMQTVRVSDVFPENAWHDNYMRIGAEVVGAADENGVKCVVGDLHRIAIWDRALSPQELGEALGQPATYFSAGLEDDANGEFGLASATGTYAPETMPWREMPRSLTEGNPCLRLVYTPHTEESRAMGAVFRLKATSASEARSRVALKIGNVSLGTQSLAGGGVAEWFVAGGTLSAGENQIEVRRVGGSGAVCAIDYLELTGSWMLGVEDQLSGEFTTEGVSSPMTYVLNWAFAGTQHCVVGSKETDECAQTELWFKVPESLARHYEFRYTGRALHQGCWNMESLTNSVADGGMGWRESQWPFGVELNGEPVYETSGVPGGTFYSFTIPRRALSNGWNVIRTRLKGDATFRWLCHDFHRFELLPNPTTTLVILR